MAGRRLIFLYFDGCEVLDFAGPLQAFHEAINFGAPYTILHCGAAPAAHTQQGLAVAELSPLPEAHPGDRIVVPGFTPPFRGAAAIVGWLRDAMQRGASLASICTGALLLADAGLLDGRRCTTHWKRVAELQRRCPSAEVLADRLFVEDGDLVTSAGIAAGIDLALALIERDHGALLAARVAREMVVYVRRDANRTQESVYLDHRTHLHPGVHAVQDFLSSHPGDRSGLPALARIAGMSTRSLTRAFRTLTGISIHAYRTRLRLEHARTLMANPTLTLDAIAAECGFADGRQLRRVWTAAYAAPPSATRRLAAGA
jgi:transcriptional regulator GlxA family with amidase domain